MQNFSLLSSMAPVGLQQQVRVCTFADRQWFSCRRWATESTVPADQIQVHDDEADNAGAPQSGPQNQLYLFASKICRRWCSRSDQQTGCTKRLDSSTARHFCSIFHLFLASRDSFHSREPFNSSGGRFIVRRRSSLLARQINNKCRHNSPLEATCMCLEECAAVGEDNACNWPSNGR